jgi:hypothetical protein
MNFIYKIIENNLELEIPSDYEFTIHLKIINSDGNLYDTISHLLMSLFSNAEYRNRNSDYLNKVKTLIKLIRNKSI